MEDQNSEKKFSRKKINFETFLKLEEFARVNPAQFRRLWLLYQYQVFRVTLDFSTANFIIKSWVVDNALRSRYPEYVYTATRSQRLGKMYEQKQDEFIDMYTKQTAAEGFDIFDYAIKSEPEDLLHLTEKSAIFVEDFFRKVLKLPADIWQAIISGNIKAMQSVYVPLPSMLEKYLAKSLSSNNGNSILFDNSIPKPLITP